MNKSQRIMNVITGISKMVTYIAAVSIIIMAVIICYDVGMRYFFNKPTHWAIEYSQYLMLAVIFLPLALVQKEKRHITVELFTNYLSPKIRTTLSELIIPILCLLVTCALLWQFAMLSYTLFGYHEVSTSALRVPLFPISLILVIGTLLLLVVLAFQIIETIRTRNSGKPGVG